MVLFLDFIGATSRVKVSRHEVALPLKMMHSYLSLLAATNSDTVRFSVPNDCTAHQSKVKMGAKAFPLTVEGHHVEAALQGARSSQAAL